MINVLVKLAVTVAAEALSVGLQASQRTYGPRLDELTVTTADFGTPIPRFLGERRFACPIFHAEDLKEVEKTTKVKGGGKQTTYHYLATFACAIADNPIDKVLKIFFDDKLVYDATGTGPISSAASLGIDLGSVMRIYYGTETQLPDPRYVTYCEDKFGPNSAPAYRGVSYLFFEDLPVDNFGNRIPQISVIATASANDAFPYEFHTSVFDQFGTFGTSSGGGWMVRQTNDTDLEWWDLATRTMIGQTDGAGASAGGQNIDLAPDGTAYCVGYFLTTPIRHVLCSCPPLSPSWTVIDVGGHVFSQPTRVFDLSDGTRQVLTGVVDSNAGYLSYGDSVTDAEQGRDFAIDADGDVWGLFEPLTSSADFTLKTITGATARSYTVTGLVTRSSPGSPTFCHVSSEAHFFVITDGKFYLINDHTTATPGTIKASGSLSAETLNLPRKNPALTSFWSGFSEISLIDGSTIQTVNPNDWIFEDTGGGQVFHDPINDALVDRAASPAGGTNHCTWRYLNRASNAGTTLGAIVSKMCDAAGLTTRDTSALTQSVAGYSWTRGDVKSQMEPVLDIHDCDARPHDFTIEFKPRGSVPSGTILTADFAKGDGSTARYKTTQVQDTDLPKILRVNFADTDFDQQTNNVLSPLTLDQIDSQQEPVIDLTTYADTPAGAQQKADRYMRRRLNGRDTVDLSLTAQQLALEPGDVTTVNLDGIAWNVKLEKQTLVGSRFDCTFRRDEQIVATLNSATAGPAMQARTVQTITVPAPIKGFVIDAPYRYDSDADVRPLLYAGAGSYGQMAYPGASIWEETGTGINAAYDQLFDSVATGATWGTCGSTLGDVPTPWLWDRGNTLTVTVQEGSLTNVAEADINADPTLNLILVGSSGNWEYVNFATATLVSGSTYTLSDFKRGRRGTEGACNLHVAGDAFILASSLNTEEMGTDDVGGDKSFKAQAIGRSLDAAPAIDIAPYSGATLKPYAPARIEWTTDGTDMFGTIIRRTRIGGSWVGGSTIPLSETTEAYEVDIYHSTTLKRTITVTGMNTFTYTGAQISADGNTVGVAPPVHAYQMSDAIGRGFALAA